MWGTVLSDPLPITGSVGRHPADYLMGRMPVPPRLSALAPKGCPQRAARRITRRFHRLCAKGGWVAYALRTRPPLSSPRRGTPVRLACIRPAASVHPEPGSNSSLYYCYSLFFFLSHGLRFPYLKPSQVPFSPVRAPLSGRAGCLVLASSSQRSLQNSSHLSYPLTPPFCGCKSTTFYINGNEFFYLFFIE